MLLHSNIIGEGQPLIILHGFLGMGDNWKTLGNRFSEQGLQVHLVDQRNHGRSFHDDAFNYEVLVSDLKFYCDEHELEEVFLLGHSMGGKTAMLFAATYPELVAKLIVADIAPRFYPTHHQDILKGLTVLDTTILKSRSEADKLLETFVSHFPTRQFLLKNLYWKDKEQLSLRVNLEVVKTNIDEVGEPLPKHLSFSGNTLFLKGDRSEYITESDEKMIRIQFPEAEIKTISNAGHWLHAENPEEFFIDVLAFIKE